MALPKKMLKEKLSELGMPEENISSAVEYILNGHTESTDALKEQLEVLKGAQANLDEITKERDALKDKLEKAGDSAKVQAEFDAYKQQVETEKRNAGKNDAVRNLLKQSGVKRDTFLNLLMEKVNLDNVEMENNAVKNADQFVGEWKEKYGDLFETVSDEGQPPMNPPSGGGTDLNALSDEEYYKQTYYDRKK